ncbi:3-deoxy-manno-octulosonate cytidylyltransferase [Photobacterium damselae subsp. piscicida]|uniref:3-deoxy-manno-octulosonate cytidylyltransferase n=1 Tax=Photobacterium damsela subsp. piscicida TaxID=38294 RepID=L7NJJ0_PHODP|nr:3-deoxy-manno-octulosonate cytidylyltransferase [Photobacterium damselae]AEU09866.1 putative 3-deoxy-manno-octulosonate cytidylyltransferase [Photobacterium damselae subsp. piscicida]MBE8129438.1 3-deoxy-manno-octulosonate cytidylyltransferase [Photobacterium damselae subsp. piscicida]MDP2514397.1 3-deoxy-manno-octulosonate cytidylyltransferase [Photobacterium damselae subsp. piscicida]MDP2532926.1 3-deoxy-manno-octulosonate cytidylyltransferase [Photobacterium damselae subsp. piscicida]MDP
MSFTVIIPARYQSTRLPGKPLADIGGKPMVQWVYEQACKSGADKVIVATDDQRVFDAVQAFGGEVCMTRSDHQSGTERLAEVVEKYNLADDHIVVNVQGDEPLIPDTIIRQVADNLAHKNAPMATLAVEIDHEDEVFNPNAVKVVTDKDGYAMYFSRVSIPWDRDHFAQQPAQIHHNLLRHIGIYAYRAGFINTYINWQPTALEQIEALEQLRVLWYGEKIHVDVAIDAPPAGVDTPEDLEKVRALIS